MPRVRLVEDKELYVNYQGSDSALVDFLMVTGNVFELIIDINKKKFLHISRSVLNVTGYSKEQIDSEFISHKGTFEYLKQNLSTILKMALRFHYSRSIGEREKFKYTSCINFKHNKGHCIWLLYHFMFIKQDEKGKPQFVMITATDITHVKQNKNVFLSVSKYDSWNNCFEAVRWESCTEGGNLVLVNKEYDIIRLIAQGYDTKQIAEILRLSKYTVEDYRKQLIHKLGGRNIYHAIKKSKEFGII